MGMGMGNFLPHGDGDGEALLDGEFPVDINPPPLGTTSYLFSFDTM